MIEIPLSKLMNDVPVGYLTDKLWITKGGKVLPIMLNEYADIEFKDNPVEESLKLDYSDYERLTYEYFLNLPKLDERLSVAKHMQGQHDQSTHGGKKSYKEINDLVKDGLDIQGAVDSLGISGAEKGNLAMRVLVERLGKGGKPEIVGSIEQLDGEPLYRGAPTQVNQELREGEFSRIGFGQYGDGNYFSNVRETAEEYANFANNPMENRVGNVLTAGWKKDAKVFKMGAEMSGEVNWMSEATRASSDAADKLNINTRASDDEDAIYNLFYNDYGNSLVTNLILQGYDGMSIDTGRLDVSETYTIVFNREALQVVGN